MAMFGFGGSGIDTIGSSDGVKFKSRYKDVQHAVTEMWAVFDTKTKMCLSLHSNNVFWWEKDNACFYACWTEDKDKVKRAAEALNETGYPWK